MEANFAYYCTANLHVSKNMMGSRVRPSENATKTAIEAMNPYDKIEEKSLAYVTNFI